MPTFRARRVPRHTLRGRAEHDFGDDTTDDMRDETTDGAEDDAPIEPGGEPREPVASTPASAAFEALLDYLKRSRGLDLTGYKRPSLMRRVDKRMQTVGVADYAAYVDYLEVHPDEFREVFNVVLINVTGFFRDPDAWSYLASQVVPAILARRNDGAPVRVWSAGCATGEEAYTLAIVLAEAMGVEAFKARVKIYATDADEGALARARQAIYEEAQRRGLPVELRDRYFERTREGRFMFRVDVRRAVIFGRHDLTQDAPISRVDLLVCRNVLMYFNAETQFRILSRFAVGLTDGGVLFLGRAETLLSRTQLFTPLDLKRRMFVKVADPGLRERMRLMNDGRGSPDSVAPSADGGLREAAFDASPVAQVVVDGEGVVVAASAHARSLFSLHPSDIGRPLQDLELSYRPLELRSRIDELNRVRQPVTVAGVSWAVPGGEVRTCDVQFCGLGPEGGDPTLGVAINFVDTTGFTRLQRELEQSNHELETAYEELQSTNEELETTNEELQSTVEELETTNEELQSTNEELETMNEELQSTNEELHTINDDVRHHSSELERVNGLLEAILTSLPGGVVVLDRELRVTAWNGQSTELWGLRRDEALGRGFLTLDIGLPVDVVRQPIRRCLAGETSVARVTADATNRRGKAIRCEVTCLPLRDGDAEVRGVILIVE
jgi:two-component system CheB/CheR fusion protein